MEHMRFSTSVGAAEPGGVLFASQSQLESCPPKCNTLYVTEQVSDAQLTILTGDMPPHSLVVLYGKA